MLILGSSLASFSWQTLKEAPWRTNLCVVFAKVNEIYSIALTETEVLGSQMVVMPCFGIGTALALHSLMTFPPHIDGSFLLVVMIVTATPTANSIAVMVTRHCLWSLDELIRLPVMWL